MTEKKVNLRDKPFGRHSVRVDLRSSGSAETESTGSSSTTGLTRTSRPHCSSGDQGGRGVSGPTDEGVSPGDTSQRRLQGQPGPNLLRPSLNIGTPKG